MPIKIKINSKDELKLIKSGERKLVLANQIHKNKKAYSRVNKYKKIED